MTKADIYQLVGEAYCNGMAHGMEKSASVPALKSLFRAASKGKFINNEGTGLHAIISKLGFNPSAGPTYGQFQNALTNKEGLAALARRALLDRASLM